MAKTKSVKKQKQPNIFKRWYTLCEPNKGYWFWQAFFYVLYATFYALITIFAAKTINCLYNGQYNLALMWLAVELGSIILRNVFLHIETIYYGKSFGAIRLNITRKIYDKILKTEDSSIKNFSTEKIINIAQGNMAEACEFPEYVCSILQYSVQVAIAIVTIYISNIYAGLIVTALGVVNFFVFNHLNKKMGNLLNDRYEKKDNSFKEYSKILSGKMVIDELNAEETYGKNLTKHIKDFNKDYSKYYRVQSFRDNLYYAIWNIVVYAITAFLVLMVSKNAMELAIYLVVVPYLSSCTDKLTTLYSKFGGIEKMRVDVDRINMILSLTDKQLVQYGDVNKSVGYNLGFIDVSYKGDYAELKNMDMSFKMNGVNIVKGERNCGKRYVFDMLRRRIKPDSGELLLDNLPLYNYNEKTFKNHIDYCSAHPVFINGTIKENLMVAKKDFAFIKALVAELGLTEKIESLPNGYNTDVSDILDGETRFWIGLIRAALSKCKVLMIYEYPEDVTPNFHKTLQHIIATCETDKRTLIFFTHKDDYDNLADMIYVINNGKVSLKKVPTNTSKTESKK